MIPSTWKPLDLQSIEEGRFMRLANDDLHTLQDKLVNFIEQYKERAEKATATMTITVALKCVDVESFSFGVKASTKLSLPQRPSSITMATAVADDETGQPTLYIRKSGSSSSDPRQGKLCTDDGERIDPDTGEIIKDGKSMAGYGR